MKLESQITMPLVGDNVGVAIHLGNVSNNDHTLYNAVEIVEDLPPRLAKSSILDGAWNLSNSTLGAGLYALPRVFAALGLIGGSLSLLFAATLTYFSVDIMLRSSEKHHKPTYAATLQCTWGRWAAIGVHATIIACCAGFIVLYLIITSDVIVGNAEYTGILNDLIPSLPDPLPWYLSRTALITWITIAAAPMLSAKSLHGMAVISAVSVACSVISMLGLLVLAVVAGVQGKLAENVRLWPDPAFFGDTVVAVLLHLLATLPVILTAFSSQMSIHPILQDLDNYTPTRMRTVVATSYTSCTLIYTLAGASGYLVFGSTVQGDVLASIQPESLAQFFGGSEVVAVWFVVAVKVAVAIAMLTSLPINLWPMREDILELLQQCIQTSPPSQSTLNNTSLSNRQQHTVENGDNNDNHIEAVLLLADHHHNDHQHHQHQHHQQNESSSSNPHPPSMLAFYSVTYGCLALIYAVAVGVTSMYTLVQFVGGTCCIMLAFVFPGLLALKLYSSDEEGDIDNDGDIDSGNSGAGKKDGSGLYWKVFGCVLLVLASVLMIAGVVSSFE